ncbi:MAG TPA: hypothetical protein IAA46_12245 [Candidatus Gemmiger avium]|nr:hypothetical protein [Candidatus Gemmiger avium]
MISDTSIRKAVEDGLSGVALSPGQKAAILARCRPEPLRVHRRSIARRALSVAAVFAVALVLSAGVLATSPGLAQQLAVLGRQTLSFLQPVNQVSEADGIRMEVLASMRSEDTAVVYLTLRDTTGQGRIQENTQLWNYHLEGASFAHAEQVDYDPETGSAMFRLTGEDVTSDKVTVRVEAFSSGIEYYPPTPTGWTVAELAELQPTPALSYPTLDHGWGMLNGPGDQKLEQQVESSSLPVLKQQFSYPVEGLDWLTVQAVGVVDNALHIQLRQDEDLGRFCSVNLSLANADGEESGQAVLDVALDEPEAGFSSGTREYVLPLPQDADPADWELYASGVNCTVASNAGWQVTFELEPAHADRTGSCDLDTGSWQLQQVSLSSLGITIAGNGELYADSLDLTPVVTLQDGTQPEFISSSVSTDDQGNIVYRMLFRTPVDTSQVATVTLSGQPVVWND